MINVGKYYKDFFGYFNALETYGDIELSMALFIFFGVISPFAKGYFFPYQLLPL